MPTLPSRSQRLWPQPQFAPKCSAFSISLGLINLQTINTFPKSVRVTCPAAVLYLIKSEMIGSRYKYGLNHNPRFNSNQNINDFSALQYTSHHFSRNSSLFNLQDDRIQDCERLVLLRMIHATFSIMMIVPRPEVFGASDSRLQVTLRARF